MSTEKLLKRVLTALLLGLGLAFFYTTVAASSFFFLFLPNMVRQGEVDLFWSPLVRSVIFLIIVVVSSALFFAAVLGYKRAWARAAHARKAHILAVVTGPLLFLLGRIWSFLPTLHGVEWPSFVSANVEEQQLETLASFSILVPSFYGCLPSLCSPALVAFALPAQAGGWTRRHVLALSLAVIAQAVISLLNAPFPSIN